MALLSPTKLNKVVSLFAFKTISRPVASIVIPFMFVHEGKAVNNVICWVPDPESSYTIFACVPALFAHPIAALRESGPASLVFFT